MKCSGSQEDEIGRVASCPKAKDGECLSELSVGTVGRPTAVR